MTTKQRFYFRSFATGGSDPDPAVYCPAAGYIPDPEVFHPPFPLPESTEQSITCICNAAYSHWRCATHGYNLSKSGSGNYLYEIFDNTATLIDSFTSSAAAVDFDFPTESGYYTVKISLASPLYFTGFYKTTGSDEINHCIEAIIMNTPNMTIFNQRLNINFTTVEWANAASFAALASTPAMFYGCKKFNYFKLRGDVDYSSLSSNYSMFSMFEKSGIKKIDLSNYNDCGSLYFTDSIARDCKYLDEFIFPSVWTGSRNFWMFWNTPRLRKVVLPTTWAPAGTPNNSLANFFNNSGVEGEVEFPSMTWITTLTSMFNNAYNIEIIRFKGDWSGLTNTSFGTFITNCYALRILEMPRITSIVVATTIFATNHTALQYYIGPDVGYFVLPTAAGLISITGEMDTTAFAGKPIVTVGTNYRTTLTEFQCAKLRVSRFVCGTSAATKFTVLNALEIDWANSDWSSTTSPQLSVSAAINATEINRIGGLVGSVSGKTCDFRYCDGYATMDKTIWTGKGWTVL